MYAILYGMHKHSFVAFLLMIVVVIIAFYVVEFKKAEAPVTIQNENVVTPPQNVIKNSDPKSITYVIDGISYPLINGKAEILSDSSSASLDTLSIFGEPVKGDLNDDGIDDSAVLLMRTTGGSGTFYYAALAVSSNGEYKSTNALFLGDRIAPQTIEITGGRAVFNYAVRKENEPMTTPPSIGKSFWIQLNSQKNEISEFIQNSDDAMNTDALKLDAHPWTWVRTDYADEPPFISKHASSFVLTFDAQNHFSSKTDCNGISGSYNATNASISFTNMMSTLIYCDGSDEQKYNAMLSDIGSLNFSNKGELLLENKAGNGTMIFE